MAFLLVCRLALQNYRLFNAHRSVSGFFPFHVEGWFDAAWNNG
jgi:hypothetical protein